MSAVGECPLCRRADAPEPPLGGWLLREEHWMAGVMPGVEVPGWAVLQSRVHVEHLWELPPAALRALGPTLARLASGLATARSTPRVYVAAFGERIPHWHAIVAAVPAGLPGARRGPGLLADFGDLVDLGEAAVVAEAARRASDPVNPLIKTIRGEQPHA